MGEWMYRPTLVVQVQLNLSLGTVPWSLMGEWMYRPALVVQVKLNLPLGTVPWGEWMCVSSSVLQLKLKLSMYFHEDLSASECLYPLRCCRHVLMMGTTSNYITVVLFMFFAHRNKLCFDLEPVHSPVINRILQAYVSPALLHGIRNLML
jgi:hypothetical protein